MVTKIYTNGKFWILICIAILLVSCSSEDVVMREPRGIYIHCKNTWVTLTTFQLHLTRNADLYAFWKLFYFNKEGSFDHGGIQIDLDHWMAPLPYCEREICRRRHHRRCPHQNHAVRARRLLMATLQRICRDRLAEHHRVRLHDPPRSGRSEYFLTFQLHSVQIVSTLWTVRVTHTKGMQLRWPKYD